MKMLIAAIAGLALVSTVAHAEQLAPTAHAEQLAPTAHAEQLAPTAHAEQLAPTARAEQLAPRISELRQPTVQKSAKSERVLSRATTEVAAIHYPEKSERMLTRSALRTTKQVAAIAHGITMDDVLTKVTGIYMTGLQRCYRKSLALDPSVSGKIDLQFNVAADGRVSSKLHGDGVERCLNTLMSTWHFGVALDDGGMPTDATFKIALVLQ